MRDLRLQTASLFLCFLCASAANAQQTQITAAVPKLVRFSGSFRPALDQGQKSPSVESATLSVYRDQVGGTALWQEVQSVPVDGEGHYSVLMGATLNEGMPLELFTSSEPRWLGVQFNRPGEVEQPRVLWASVPYALKASDAETLGGRPASAYLLAEPLVGSDGATSSSATAAASTAAKSTNAVKPRASAGTVNFVGKFVDSTNLGSSSIYDFNGAVGIGTVTPTARLELSGPTNPILRVNGAAPGAAFLFNSQIGTGQDRATMGVNAFFNGNWNLVNTQEPSWLLQLRTAEDDFGILRAAPGAVDFGNHELFTVKGNGNVGIGTQPPGWKLDVAGDINFSGALRFQGSPMLRPILGGNSLFTDNLGVGIGALQNNTTGTFNMAIGTNALQANTTGSNNMATGNRALLSNTTGSANSATGVDALQMNVTGNDNTADGNAALNFNTSGGENTAIGATALFQNTVGNRNMAVGSQALLNNTTGGSNTAIGYRALSNNSSGNSNIAIGFQAGNGVTGSNNIHIGNTGLGGDNAFIRIGTPGIHTAFFTAGVRGVTTGSNDAIPVVIDSNGQLGTVSSSRRFKEEIEDMGTASEGLMRLRPVTYRYKQPFADGSKPIQYGLIAEEVDEVYPELVAHSADGKIETVKYQVLDSMLLNEVQRQQAEIRKLEKENQSLQERLAKIEKALTTTQRP